MRTQRQYKDKIAKVIKCQSVIKAFLLRRQYLEIKASASLIQQRFREFKAMRGEREEFLKKKSAALSVQSWWRMIKQRREYREEVSKVVKCQALVRQRLQRH